MPLTFADIGKQEVIKMIKGNETQRQHLNDLGIIKGATVSVVSKMNGNIIISIKNSRIAISKEIASKIMI